MEKKKNGGFPYAISIIRHQLYNPAIAVDNDHIQIFELMLALADIHEKKGKLQFYHKIDIIAEEAKLKPYTVRKAIKHWQDLGVLKIEKKGLHNNSYYSINYFILQKLIPELYRKFRTYEPDDAISRATKEILRRKKRRKEILNRGGI